MGDDRNLWTDIQYNTKRIKTTYLTPRESIFIMTKLHLKVSIEF